jgi:hypothetical protein
LSQHANIATPPASDAAASSETAAPRQPCISPSGIEQWSPPLEVGPDAVTPEQLARTIANLYPPKVPYWVPQGVQLADMPHALTTAIADVVNPTYRELVLEASSALERSTGLSVVYLLWMEIIDHLELHVPVDCRTDPVGLLADRRARTLEHHLRLVHAKLKATELLIRLKEFKQQWDPAVRNRRDERRPLTDSELERLLLQP